MAAWATPPDPPPPQHQKTVPRGTNAIDQKGQKLEIDLRDTNLCFWPLPPGCWQSLPRSRRPCTGAS